MTHFFLFNAHAQQPQLVREVFQRKWQDDVAFDVAKKCIVIRGKYQDKPVIGTLRCGIDALCIERARTFQRQTP